MKKLILMLVVALFAVGSINAQNKVSTSVAKVEIQTNASKNCQKCVDRFKENVPFFKGVKDYTFDSKTAKITVFYDGAKTNPEQIRMQISKLGYDADNVKADAAARAKLPNCCKGGSCGDSKAEQHKCSHAEGEHKCQGAANGQHSCNHQCQGAANGEQHKCSHAEGEHKCQGAANGQHSCNHQCQGAANGEQHKCSHAEGEHKCQGAANGQHNCNHQCQGHK